ncbi:MAG: hypothetical protein JO354_01965 [Verrucomicrobia bacterium]|nr:hypothetical protein [Verrucomicrobiota bacterium]
MPAPGKTLPPNRTPPPSADAPSALVRNIRRLLWLYIFLLVIEGALRKWVVPQLSNPLLLVRDPIVLVIYLLAARAGVWPRNWFMYFLVPLALLSWITGVLVLEPYVPMSRVLIVTSYGFRSNFLHLPLIFVFANVFDAEDVKKIGWWILLGMIPMGLIMALQFHASPDSFINRTVGLGEGEQITAGGGKIRPPGTFSFISGPIYYVALASAFAIFGALSRATYRNWLLVGSGLSILLAIVVSGSRSLVLSVLLVVFSLAFVLLLRPDAVNRLGRTLFVIVVASYLITRIPIVQHGLSILSDRFTESAEVEETSVTRGLIERTLGGFTEGLTRINRIPLGGYGLGLGTNVGARALVGRVTFLLAENEWSRVLLESGPILGLAFLVWRTALVCRLGALSLGALGRAEILPLLLFSAGFIVLLNGQFGQPTSLGFAVVLNGLCLASTRPRKLIAPPLPSTIAPRRPRGRSPYAERLHRADPTPATNGSVDR